MDWRDKSFAIWGERWKYYLARIAGYRKRQIQRWNADNPPINPKIEDKINQTYNIWRDDE